MTAFAAVLCYIAWTLLLALSYAFPRVIIWLSGKQALTHWERGQPVDDPSILQRAKGAHLNCVENLPLFVGVVAMAALMGKTGVIDPIAPYVLYARLGQSTAHLIGASTPLILVRATFFLAQVAMIFVMVFKLLG